MKTVPLYHVEYVLLIGERWEPWILLLRDPGRAEAEAKLRRNNPKLYACVHVSGPHPHQVPA